MGRFFALALAAVLGLTFIPALLASGRPGASDLGVAASLHGMQIFPADNPWNQNISRQPIDPHSDILIDSIGANKGLHPDFGTVWNGAPNGIPYVVVAGTQKPVPIIFDAYGDESDPGPYPIPPGTPIEGGPSSDGDRHVIVLDRDHAKLYELWHARELDNGARWSAGSGAIFDLTRGSSRPIGWTSADAAGLPIFPGLVRYDEVAEQKKIAHALRFTIAKSRRAYVPPASHFASRSEDVKLPPMGMRVRLRSDFDESPFPPHIRVILEAMKNYGMIVADNGSDWFVSGAPDPRWNEDELHLLGKVKGKDFQVIEMKGLKTR